MTDSLPIKRVVDLLVGAGYRLQSRLLKVSNIPFEFSAVLLGGHRSQDLLVVVDTLGEDTEKRIQQKVDSLSRALDLAQSRRPLTVITVGPSMSALTLESLSRVARVLQVGAVTGPDSTRVVEDALAVLLPLDLPKADLDSVDPLGELRTAIATATPMLIELLDVAGQGAEDVRQALSDLISKPFVDQEGAT